jgi:hypothetical protein
LERVGFYHVVRKLQPDGVVESHIYLIRQSVFGEIAQRLGSIPPTGLLMVLTPFMPTTRMEVGDSAEANLSDSTLQLQTSDSSRQLSLWQNEPVAAGKNARHFFARIRQWR